MYGMKLPEAQELFLRILMAQAKASVTIEWADQPGLGWYSERKSYSCAGYRKLLNAGNEERKTEMKGLKVWGQKAIKRTPKS